MASLPSTTSLTTHLFAFLAGVAAGKSLDAEELNAYRSANETFMSRVGRRLKYFLAGSALFGLVIKLGSSALLKNGDTKGDTADASK